MSNEKQINILFPTARLINGSLYDPKTTNMNDEPLVYKTGKKLGEPRVDYYIGIAIPKTPGCTHWSQEVSQNPRVGAWGKKIWDAAYNFWGDLATNNPKFSWKITDGDSTEFDGGTPARPPKRHCDKANYPGNWIVHLGRGLAPKIVNQNGSQFLLEKDQVKCGYYIQVAATIRSNETNLNPGIYLNHDMISLQFAGEEIISGVDPMSIGFGGDAPPPGAVPIIFSGSVPATAIPLVSPPAPIPQRVPPVPVQSSAPMPPPVPVPSPVLPTPNYGFVNEAAGIQQERMLTNGATYASYIAAGWSEQQLKDAGLV